MTFHLENAPLDLSNGITIFRSNSGRNMRKKYLDGIRKNFWRFKEKDLGCFMNKTIRSVANPLVRY